MTEMNARARGLSDNELAALARVIVGDRPALRLEWSLDEQHEGFTVYTEPLAGMHVLRALPLRLLVWRPLGRSEVSMDFVEDGVVVVVDGVHYELYEGSELRETSHLGLP